MRVATTVGLLGGVATWAQLRARHTEHAIRVAASRGEVVRVARARYAGPDVDAARREAHRHGAVLSHLSAAVAHGWPVVRPADRPWLIVPRHRRVESHARAGVHLHWAELPAEDRHRGVTSPVRTVVDCARALSFQEALAVADSALRAGHVSRAELRRAAAMVRGPGVRGIRAVAEQADGRAANPLESALRAATVGIAGTAFVPQWTIAEPGLFAVADLADPDLKLVLEAEGYAAHGSREGWRSDARRFTALVAYGWSVLRFPYEDVVDHPGRVVWAVRTWLDQRPPVLRLAPDEPARPRLAVPG